MQVEHELRQRPVEPRHRPRENSEARTRKPCRRLEVEPRRRGGDLVMLARPEGAGPRLARPAELHVLGLAGPVRHRVERQVRQAEEVVAQPCILRRRLGLEARDLVLLRGDKLSQALELGRLAAGPGLAHRLRGRIPLRERGLRGGDPRPPPGVNREHLARNA